MILGLLIGAPATVILFEWATPLTTLVYNAPEAGLLLKILAPMFFLHYFDAPLHAILLGLGRAKATLWNYVVATIFKACLDLRVRQPIRHYRRRVRHRYRYCHANTAELLFDLKLDRILLEYSSLYQGWDLHDADGDMRTLDL